MWRTRVPKDPTMTQSTRISLGVVVLALAGGGAYVSTLKGASNLIDPSRLATVELAP